MNSFKGLSGYKLNIGQKDKLKINVQKNQEHIRPFSNSSIEKELSMKRLKSQNIKLDKFHSVKHQSLNKSQLPKFEKKISNLKKVKQEQEVSNDKTKQILQGMKKTVRKSEIVKTIILKQNKTNKQILAKVQSNFDWKRLECFFRYYPITVVFLCNEKEELMKQYSQGNVKVFGNSNPKKSVAENYERLVKTARLKGKYKYRERHNPNLNQQIKSLGYRFIRKQGKTKKKQQTSSEESEEDKKQKYRDLEGWKKNMGVNGKVFIIKGGYRDLRASLLERGWVENPDKFSKLFDLKWTTKINDVQFEQLQSKQLVNHFNNNQSLTSKYGLCKTLRTIIYNEGVDVDRFFPRCFDLSDLSDFENFIENYKWNYVQSLIKNFVQNPNKFEGQQSKIKIAINVLERRTLSLNQIVDHINSKLFVICNPEQWSIIHDGQNKPEIVNRLLKKYQDQGVALFERASQVLQKLKAQDPQYDLSGNRNIWILKPNYLSRGRGIKCIIKLNDILDYAIGKDIQFVAQKYIQNPLIVLNRKFDIRQWVLVEDYNPPKIWFYDECYLRFCAEEYNMQNINNKFVHLTNNSIQKYSKEFAKSDIEGNMWSMAQFMQHLSKQQDKGIWQQIRKKMKDIVIYSIKSTQDQVAGRKNSFQLFGYDFMIDSNYNPWLIEINSSPAMDYSTPVTKRLVKMVMEDTVKVTIDSKSKKKSKNGTGLFKCIYKGETTKTMFPII